MKKQRLAILTGCVLLLALQGCHKPVAGVVMVSDANDNPPAQYVESGGTLEFRTESTSYPVFTIAQEKPLCTETALQGTAQQPVTCHIPKNAASGFYNLTVTELDQLHNEKNPRKTILRLYIRPCSPACK